MTAVAPTTTPIDPDRTIPTLLLAFSADPVVRWLLPGTGPYHAVFGALVRLAAGDAFTAGTVDVAYDGAGVAVWAPPGAAVDDDGYAELFRHHIDPTRQADVLAWGEQVGSHHSTPLVPRGPGRGPPLAASGLRLDAAAPGAGALRPRRAARLPGVRQPPQPPLFERHGFEVVAEIQVSDSPPLWSMLREPQP